MLKFRSVNNIVRAPAKTGSDNNKRKAVINIDQTNNVILKNVNPGTRIFIIVAIKFIAPKIEAAPAMCKLKIVKSTAGPKCPIKLDNGGYSVHPVPVPISATFDNNNNIIAGGNNQKLKLFKRGKAISAAPVCIGINQFPKPPINIGITIKKIIINPCPVIKTLYNCWFSLNNVSPGNNAIRMIIEYNVPTNPQISPNIIYNVPIVL